MHKNRTPPPRLRSTKISWIGMGLVALVASLCAARAVQAEVSMRIDQETLTLSRNVSAFLEQMGPLPVAPARSITGSSHSIRFNGIELRAETRSIVASSAEISALFTSLRSQCQLPHSDDATSPDSDVAVRAPVLERIGARESYLYCLKPRARLNLTNLKKMAQSFSESLDLAEIGQLLGLYARSLGDRHQLLMLEAPGPMRVTEAFALQGDTPGVDLPHLPRPSGRRSASIHLDGAPRLNVYEVSRLAPLEGYARQLRQAGLDVLEPTGPHGTKTRSLLASAKEATYLIVHHPAREPGAAQALDRLSVTRLPH